MKQSIQNLIQNELSDTKHPSFETGDTVRVNTREEIGGQMRTRTFAGVCIERKGEGPNQTFKVRKISFGVGVERIFPLYSPIIESIEIIRKGKVRRAKLSYLEGRSTRDARIKERRADSSEAARPVEEKDEAETVETTSPDEPEGNESSEDHDEA